MVKIRVGGDKTGLWCNGNTEDFGPSVMGSSPVSPTNIFLIKILKKYFTEY